MPGKTPTSARLSDIEIERRLRGPTTDLLEGFRAVVVNGPRQAGKSTLVRQIQHDRGEAVNLDDPLALELAIDDPIAFLGSLPPRVAIDEFQRAGAPLLLALKMRLDADRSPGQFILAGSTRFLSMRSISETLTGRVGIVELLPLSAGEIRGVHEQFVSRLFDGTLLDHDASRLSRRDYADAVAAGGFPEIALGPTTDRFRSQWCRSYLDTVTAVANVEPVAEIRRPDTLRALVSQLAARSSAELVVADLARELAATPDLTQTYLATLGTLYIVRLLPAWTTSRTNRSKRRPVAHFIDTALATHLLGETADSLADLASPWFGPLLESYVVGEVAKQSGWADRPVTINHYRDRDQREVDLVLERGREIAAIEVKATSTPTLAHAKHLAFLRDRAGERFRFGVVLHTGTQAMSLGDRLAALPISALWA